MQSEPDMIVERSPKQRFIRFNEPIGKGTYKSIYRGYDEESGCEVAWNVIHLDQLPQCNKERKRISEELSILNNIRHPNIISFINAWVSKSKNEIIFITELIHGGSLKKHLRKIQKPRVKIFKHWCREILKGLAYLHSLQPFPIIHRDIKCDNIFINTHNNQLRIGDLGLAIKLKQADFTQSVLGTPEFMAPEIYEESYGTSVDIYAFGMTCLEMATQRRPYEECTTPAQIYEKVKKREKPMSINLINNKELKEFILKCLEDHQKRPSANDLLNDKFLSVESEEDNQHIQILEESEIQVNNRPKIKIREQLDLDKSVIILLRDSDQLWIKIFFTDRQFYNLKFIELINSLLDQCKDNEELQQEILKIDGVEKYKWVSLMDESKYLIKRQLFKALDYYNNNVQSLLNGMSVNELEQLEQQIIGEYQNQRRNQKQ